LRTEDNKFIKSWNSLRISRQQYSYKTVRKYRFASCAVRHRRG